MTIPTADRVLSLDEAARLGELIRAVERNAKIDWYAGGSKDFPRAVQLELRCFTYGTGAYQTTPNGHDVRDLHVWASGTFEHWFAVPDLLNAMRNALDAFKGLDAPMLVIRPETAVPEEKHGHAADVFDDDCSWCQQEAADARAMS